ncbi:batten's disease protein Cln3 [Sparassis latifolia]|uniref:Protein BTN n=1 Tax=Sparassis crispa TaxID=139825 RepID=A0A401H5W5_9APHY|nr:Protein BTN1 [Sparassis crispa]GBE89783.1 Protein BTN1 [Sparassis crispa]
MVNSLLDVISDNYELQPMLTPFEPHTQTNAAAINQVQSRRESTSDRLTVDISGEGASLLSGDSAEGDLKEGSSGLLLRLGLSFFLFGFINNVLYVIILSAALDLVPPSTPKGIIAFCNIFPALVAKLGWPYLLKGRIRYSRRLLGCCVISVSGMIVVALSDSLSMRLLGISLASFSSGLGELTFLQLSVRYHPPSVAGRSVSYFASGTGAAGLVGAFLWWELRGLGVRIGVGLSSVLPLAIPLAYFLLLPRSSAFSSMNSSSYEEPAPSVIPYAALSTTDDEDGPLPSEPEVDVEHKRPVGLSASDKWRLAKPLLTRYMLPLFCVYLFEYIINQGVAPTLVYPVPSPDQYWLMSKLIHSIRDYYPLWQLVYQTTVFFSRSSISIGLPPLPGRLLSLPAILQAIVLSTLTFESAVGIFGDQSEGLSFFLVFFLISIEGICGGLAYVNVFYRINQERHDSSEDVDPEHSKQEREFKIGSMGLADSTGIVFASLLAMPTEVELCRVQVRRGKMFCQSL